jgi:hypothetical protein
MKQQYFCDVSKDGKNQQRKNPNEQNDDPREPVIGSVQKYHDDQYQQGDCDSLEDLSELAPKGKSAKIKFFENEDYEDDDRRIKIAILQLDGQGKRRE